MLKLNYVTLFTFFVQYCVFLLVYLLISVLTWMPVVFKPVRPYLIVYHSFLSVFNCWTVVSIYFPTVSTRFYSFIILVYMQLSQEVILSKKPLTNESSFTYLHIPTHYCHRNYQGTLMFQVNLARKFKIHYVYLYLLIL